MPYSTIFFGTSDFSLPSLQALIDDPRFEVKAVVTKPDMKVGRHQETVEPPVKVMAKKNGILVLQFESIKNAPSFEILKRIQDESQGVDAYIVVSYGKIIPQRVLDLPKFGVINVHGSLLPKHRGASCVQSAIASGDKETGVTIMLMDAEMDHGPILMQKSTDIHEDDTGGSLHDRLADLGGVVLPGVLADYIEQRIIPKDQDHDMATYCKILKREDGLLDWSKSADEIERLIRAYNPWPGTYTIKDDKRIKIYQAKKSNHESRTSNHTVINEEQRNELIKPSMKEGHAIKTGEWLVLDQKLLVGCGEDSALEILELQPEGKRKMTAKEYLAGNKQL
jgi:methionyl-tRNA formyltransferase